MNRIREVTLWFKENGNKLGIEELMKYAVENEINTNEKELTRLWYMYYEKDEIFEPGFLEKFHEIKDELDTTVKQEKEKAEL